MILPLINFGAGPAKLPVEVVVKIKEELMNWNNTGLSILEIGHRTNVFVELIDNLKALVKRLLKVPDHFSILFMPGGGQVQFAVTAMNLTRGFRCANFVETGYWSNHAATEAKKFTDVHIAASGEKNQFLAIPSLDMWKIKKNGAYLHFTDNETINGLEYSNTPDIAGMPLVSDMSSNIFSRFIDFGRVGCVYACAQKNLGIPGMSIVIVREDLLDRAIKQIPEVYSYAAQHKNNSLVATPPTFVIYVAYLVLQWLDQQGGVEAMSQLNQQKAEKVYQLIDNSSFYVNQVAKKDRSRMNIPFRTKDDELEKHFLHAAAQKGLVNLEGHRSMGGMRASLYNSISLDEVDRLVSFMREFAHSV
jgi:phosphoserine aminotransferase